MCILGDAEIEAEIDTGRVIISPFDPSRLQPNSYDLSLGSEVLTYVEAENGLMHTVLDPYKDNPTTSETIPPEGLLLHPGILYLAHTREIAGTTKQFVPDVSGKSSIARLGLSVHITAGWGDVGFAQQWTLEMFIAGKHSVRVHVGMPIAQIRFTRVENCKHLYTGRYANQSGVVASKYHEGRSKP